MANLKSPVRERYVSDMTDIKTPPRWKRPDEVMRLHRVRAKHKALQARMKNAQISSNQPLVNTSIDSVLSQETEKRKNPFKKSDTLESCNSSKRIKPQILDESTSNLSVFQFLRYDESTTSNKNTSKLTSFKNIFNQSSGSLDEVKVEPSEIIGSKNIPVDWKLRTKARFLSLKPFSWNSKLKTCEEASGTTAFVRCIDSNSEDCSLDTSANAQFHQCCLVWQHPVLPWVELYPRNVHTQNNAAASLFSSQTIRDFMHSAWTESFRSAFQLVRAQQCPYFYVLGNTFTCLFRAAGICGHSEINAMITPTTRGFRQALKDEDIEFTMPLKDSEEKRRSFENQTDTGYSSLDVTTNDGNTSVETTKSKGKNEENDNYDDDEEDEDDEEWLQSMGVDENEIKRISNSQSEKEFGKEKQIDKTPESLVYVEGVEAQALFNFLMNCKSNIAVTGPLAGIPPTILAPVAFHGATLRPLKVRQNIVNTGAEQYHSIEIRGPVLPHVVHSVANLLKQSLDTFSLTFASIESTTAFSLMHKTRCLSQKKDEKKVTSESTSLVNSIAAFGQVNLCDCGLSPASLHNFCKGDIDSVQSFDSLKYSDNLFTWS